MQKVFTVRLIENLRDRIQGLADELLNQVQTERRMDLIRDYAIPIPTTIIAELLGVPVKDRHKFHRWSSSAISSTSSRWGMVFALPHGIAFLRYIRNLVKANQVNHNLESQKLQYAMEDRLRQLGWCEIEVVDDDLGRTAAGTVARAGFERMVAEVCLGRVGAVAAREVSRFARNSRDWQQLIEVCRVVDTLLIDQETVYTPRQSNDRLLLGLKGSLNEYELDLLRQRSLEARRAKAQRGELIVAAPVGFIKMEESPLEKDPDRRVQQAIALVFDKCLELGSARQTLLWFLEQGLDLPTRNLLGEISWKRPSYTTVYQMLTNPTYAGAYAYGKTELILRYENGGHGRARIANLESAG